MNGSRDAAAGRTLIRCPRVQDAAQMLELINARAARGEILARSRNYIFQNIRDFCVLEQGGRIVACGALHVLWQDLGEVRALASAADAPADSEARIVRALLDEGRRVGLAQVFAFASFPAFFLSLGFAEVPKDSLPRIAWRECIDCVKFPACDEVPVAIDIEAHGNS
jgi:amino-acid N-acetyltransferase